MRTITFEHAPPFQQLTTCFPDDPHKSIVREDGSLNYGWHDPLGFEKRKEYWKHASQLTEFADPGDNFLVRLKPRFTHRDKLINTNQHLEGPRVPIVVQEEEYEHTQLSWTIASIRDENFRADLLLWKVTAKPTFGRAPSKIELCLTGNPKKLPVIIESKGTTSYWTKDGLQLPGLMHYGFLNSGETKEGVFLLVLQGKIHPEIVTLEWAKRELKKVRTYWLELPLYKNPIQIPDTQVQDMIDASARNILQAREIENGITEYKVGPTVYRSLFMVDGYFLLEAAHILGDQELAFNQGILAILRRAKPDGSIQIIPQHYKETGIAIATIVRQCELMGDDGRLVELWPTILRAVDYIEILRNEAHQMGPDYPGYKLFPPAYLDGGISGPFPDYTTPGWILVGLKFAKEVGSRLELPGLEKIRKLYDEIFEGFISCAQRDIGITPEGIPYLPMIMEHRSYNKPQTATWAFAQTIYPGEVFPQDHPYVQNLLSLLDSVDDEQGIPKETGWIHDQAVWGYSAMFYAQVWLYAGRPDKAIDYLYAFANHASPARVWREEQSLTNSRSSEYCGDMPHNWGSAEFIRLVRNALVFERQNRLELLVGLPTEWLPTKERDLILEKTPTKFGLVSIRLSIKTLSTYEFSYHRDPGLHEPKEVIVHWNNNAFLLSKSEHSISLELEASS